MNQNFAIGMFIDSILKTLQLMKIVTLEKQQQQQNRQVMLLCRQCHHAHNHLLGQ